MDHDKVKASHSDNNNSDNTASCEMTTIVLRLEGEGGKASSGGSGENRDLIHSDEVKVKIKELLNDDKDSTSSVIDVKGGGEGEENLDGEMVCRICHLSSDQTVVECTSTSTSTGVGNEKRGLMRLGCDCKDELGVAHSYCAEAWFKLKGNRLCEICGETATNITGVGDNRFMQEWDDRRSGFHSSERSGGCWRGQPFCNFLMACLVIAFVLPWFFRVNMF